MALKNNHFLIFILAATIIIVFVFIPNSAIKTTYAQLIPSVVSQPVTQVAPTVLQAFPITVPSVVSTIPDVPTPVTPVITVTPSAPMPSNPVNSSGGTANVINGLENIFNTITTQATSSILPVTISTSSSSTSAVITPNPVKNPPIPATTTQANRVKRATPVKATTTLTATSTATTSAIAASTQGAQGKTSITLSSDNLQGNEIFKSSDYGNRGLTPFVTLSMLITAALLIVSGGILSLGYIETAISAVKKETYSRQS